MQILTPDADEVFNKWLSNVDSKKLKKSFGIDKEAITAAESVKIVEKSAFLFFISEINQKKKHLGEKETKFEDIHVSKLKDVTFYSFSSKGVDRNVWKGKKDLVPLLSNLKEVRCKRCNGKGTEKCGQCNNYRFIVCEQCKGREIRCDTCKGSGKISIALEVKEVSKNGEEITRKVEKTSQCPSCFGLGKINCQKCGGTGRIVCYNCKGNLIACRDCNGHGILYEFNESPVPLLSTPSKEFHPFMVKKDEWMLKDREYNQIIESIETYPVQDPKNLNEKKFRELLEVPSLSK